MTRQNHKIFKPREPLIFTQLRQEVFYLSTYTLDKFLYSSEFTIETKQRMLQEVTRIAKKQNNVAYLLMLELYDLDDPIVGIAALTDYMNTDPGEIIVVSALNHDTDSEIIT